MTTDKITYNVKRSKRKSLGIRIEYDGSITVLAPFLASAEYIDEAIAKNKDWILKKQSDKLSAIGERRLQPIYLDEIKALKARALTILPDRLNYYAELLGVSYSKLSVKPMLSRWGSCSAQQSISINCLLMLAPDEVIDYILVHELSHVKHMNHSRAFYAFIDAHFPHRKQCEKWLKSEGVILISRVRLAKDKKDRIN